MRISAWSSDVCSADLVWLNLLGNAVKYSAHSEPAVIEISHDHEADGSHRFSVRDNGAGFDMAYADKLFGVFQRLHAASEFSGTGIGLASVQRVITRPDGRVWAASEPGNDATFHFTLPAPIDPDESKGKPQTARSKPSRQPKQSPTNRRWRKT